LPIIRADISLIEKYKYRENNPLNCNITTIGGTDDPTVLIEDIKPWASHTSLKYDHHMLNGDHFFIRTNIKKLLDIINCVIAM
jgi:medium-chain acyl-[acyl-carrier-protein] hydrolase